MNVTLCLKPDNLEPILDGIAAQVAFASGSLVVNFEDDRPAVVVPLDEIGNLVIVSDSAIPRGRCVT